MRSFIAVISVLVFYSASVLGQDCSSPINICEGDLVQVDSVAFSSFFSQPCFTASNSAYFTFTTNNSAGNISAFLPYDVDVFIEIESCIDAGLPLDVTAGIFEPVTPQNFCGALTEVAPCSSSSSQLSFNSGLLSPNTTYVLVIGINPTSAGFGCDVSISLTGDPLGIEAFLDQSIALGESTDPLEVFGTTPLFGVESYVWSPTETLDDFQSNSPIATPNVTTTYTVEAMVGDCLVTSEVLITVSKAITPVDLFSPNGDFINDTWKIFDIEEFESAKITVYDRWGQAVYKSVGYKTPWDGTNDGKKLVTGTYYYVIELNSRTVRSEPLTGSVLLVN